MLDPAVHPIFADLYRLGLSDPESLCPYYPRVRDRDDISILKCARSGAFLLSRCDHIDDAYYQSSEDLSYWNSMTPGQAVLNGAEDLERRSQDLRYIVANKRWLDVGTGVGGILQRNGPLAAEAAAVEPQSGVHDWLRTLGYPVYADLQSAPARHFDVVTLFHVFEHVVRPLEFLKDVRARMAPGGVVVVEVPHARDFLLSFLDLEAFKGFTFWSEHLLLHTRWTLEAFLRAAGFQNVSIKGCQRYPLANHLMWLARGLPAGHSVWPELRTSQLDEAYGNMLANLDMTDTLLAMARAS
jgi:2-polyprenyl-3-methyl-5-hydroxy-6-metoxy-1,4-benzoquinol methylase